MTSPSYNSELGLLLLIFGTAAFARLPDPPIFSTVQHYPSICYLPPDSGLCRSNELGDNTVADASNNAASTLDATSEGGAGEDLQIHYYFDVTTEQCYPFGTQNCGGNENRFGTLTDCQARCQLRG